jgi:hypothetical protein
LLDLFHLHLHLRLLHYVLLLFAPLLYYCRFVGFLDLVVCG